jgi:hypothetical protein
MACYNNCYLPQPPRDWSRVQNSCSTTIDITNTTNGFIRMPLTGELVPPSLLAEKMAMLNKGNVLQYKANSSNLTSVQRYSKIAKGQWTNRNTTWATQSTRGYTNPNNSSLKRAGNVVNVSIDPITGEIIGETNNPVTCPKPIIIINEGLPANSQASEGEPSVPPPVDPTPASETFPAIESDTPVEPIVIQDDGNLICSIQEDVCTGLIKSSLSQKLCNPTTDSDVPGQIQDLCWNDGTPTWYPRQRYIMTNSTNKWPVNAQLLSAVKPYPAVITSITAASTTITLIWTQNNSCIEVTGFDIFQNGILVKSVNNITFTTDINVNPNSFYEYYIISRTSGNVASDPSNTVSIQIT